MKKIILGLFLILGAISFAVPKNLDADKVKKAGYEIARDEDSAVILGKATDDAGITVALFLGNVNAKGVSDSIKATAPKNQKFLSSRETKKAYISILYVTDTELSSVELNNAVNKILNEVESYLK